MRYCHGFAGSNDPIQILSKLVWFLMLRQNLTSNLHQHAHFWQGFIFSLDLLDDSTNSISSQILIFVTSHFSPLILTNLRPKTQQPYFKTILSQATQSLLGRKFTENVALSKPTSQISLKISIHSSSIKL